MIGSGFVGGLFAEQHENVIEDEENAGEAFGDALGDIQKLALAVPSEHCPEPNCQEQER